MMDITAAKDRILDRVPLATLVGETVELTTRSGRPVGRCPFHEEKTGSFTIYDDHYFCFGCRARGDAIDFVRQQHGLGFMEALRYLAEKYNIDAPELARNQQARDESRSVNRYYQLMGEARAFFTEHMERQGAGVVQYLGGRGFSPEHIRSFGFGLSPDNPVALVQELQQRGFTVEEIIRCSLASTSNRTGRPYDFFRNRLMIPIEDRHGRTIAFGGRAMDKDDPAKYKNSRETPVFNKSRVLFGLMQAREAIRKKKRVLVVEGYMDALQLRARGLEETVACLGTALTLDHMHILGNMTREAVLIFDGDESGRRAGLRTVTHALEVPVLRVRVVNLPRGEDPDSYVLQHGVEGLEQLIGGARDLLDHSIITLLGEARGLAIPDLIRNQLLPWLGRINDPVQRAFLIARISQLTDIPREDLNTALQQNRGKAPAASAPPAPEPPPPVPVASLKRLESFEKELLYQIYFAQPGELETDGLRRLIDRQSWDEVWRDFARAMADTLDQDHRPAEVAQGNWAQAVYPEVMAFLESGLKNRNLWMSDQRQARITHLESALRESELRISLRRLHGDLKRLSGIVDKGEEEYMILKAIQDINKELLAIEKSRSHR